MPDNPIDILLATPEATYVPTTCDFPGNRLDFFSLISWTSFAYEVITSHLLLQVSPVPPAPLDQFINLTRRRVIFWKLSTSSSIVSIYNYIPPIFFWQWFPDRASLAYLQILPLAGTSAPIACTFVYCHGIVSGGPMGADSSAFNLQRVQQFSVYCHT